MFKKILLLLLLVTTYLAAPAFAAPDGEVLYKKHCVVCHNERGIGGIGLPLNGTKINDFSREYLFTTIRLGREGRIMPAFAKLSDAQVNAIVDYVLSWRGDKRVPIYSDITVVGDLENGARIYQKECAECHGKDGKSEGVGTGVTVSRKRNFEVIPPALNNPGFLAAAKDTWIRHTINEGRLGTSMPSKASMGLSDQDVNDLVSYIRSFETQYKEKEPLEDTSPTLVFDSPYDFTTTVANIKQSLQGMNFRYFPDRYMEMGLADDRFINKRQLSIRFCNFNSLYRMINTDPRLGVVLPCRITVVEQPQGEVKLYVMNMRLVSRLFNNDQLDENAISMFESVIAVIDEATL
jgi:cytochrome c oxidase cbb3-type subunit 3